MPYEVTLSEQAGVPTLVVRTRASVQDLPRVLGEGFGAVAGYLAGLGQTPAGPPFSAYFNTDMQNLDVEIGFPVAEPLAGAGQVQASRFESGPAAACLHVGPYAAMGAAYAALEAWMVQNGYEPAGPAYEIYLNDPGDTPHDQLQTLVRFPVRLKV